MAMPTQQFVKESVSLALLPILRLSGTVADALGRLLSYARLKARLPALQSSVVVQGMPEIHGTAAVRLGRNLLLYPGLYLETRHDGAISVGDDVVISRGVHLVSYSSIEIGAGSMIGEYASIRDANHRFGPDIAPRHAGHTASPIRIGRNVWIGRGVTVLAGVTIGDGAVVGANAVVTRDVPAGAVVGGTPARVLRSAEN